MNKLFLIHISLIFFLSSCSNESSEQLQQFNISASAQIQLLAGTLKKELVSAMQSQGPASAVKVCNVKAPEITSHINASSQFKIKRTSFKVRNQKNAADEWESNVLDMFAKQHAEGVSVSDLIYSEHIENNGITTLRMMKAIPVQAVCLTCHGKEQVITEDIKEILAANYPNDKATGYTTGDLRGAFSVSQTISN